MKNAPQTGNSAELALVGLRLRQARETFRDIEKRKAEIQREEMALRSDIAGLFNDWAKARGFSHTGASGALLIPKSTYATWVRDVGEKRASIENMLEALSGALSGALQGRCSRDPLRTFKRN